MEQSRGLTTIHQYLHGGALGGPILRNRLFFFANYEGFRQSLAAPQGGFAPTQDMFSGNFSDLPSKIYDPASFNSATGQRQVFPDNVIPPTRVNPVAQKLLGYYLPGSGYNMRPLNVFAEPVQTQVSDQGGLRVDANLSKTHTLFCQYMHEESPVDNPALFPASGLYYHMNTELAMVQLTSTLSPRVVNEVHAGFTRPYLFYGGIGQAGVQQKAGLTGTADGDGVPGITMNGFSSFGTPQSVIGNIDNNYQLYESLKILHGNHEKSVGANLHYVRTVQESANWNARGTLVFNSVFTAQLAPAANGQPAPVSGTGNSFADFLLGIPVNGTVTSMPRTHYRWTELNPYVQDTWRLRRDFQNTMAELAYIGSASRRLPVRWNVNDCSTPGSLACTSSAIRWPQYSYVYFAANAAFSNYNAFNAKFQREFSGGFDFLANYTWSKALTNTYQGGANTPLNQMGSCLVCDRSLAGFNIPHRLTVATVWELPVGRGRRFLGDISPLVDRVIGGWAADVITTFSSGNPFTVNAPNSTTAPLTNFRADRVCNGRADLQPCTIQESG